MTPVRCLEGGLAAGKYLVVIVIVIIIIIFAFLPGPVQALGDTEMSQSWSVPELGSGSSGGDTPRRALRRDLCVTKNSGPRVVQQGALP